jgi:hypothetical protein
VHLFGSRSRAGHSDLAQNAGSAWPSKLPGSLAPHQTEARAPRLSGSVTFEPIMLLMGVGLGEDDARTHMPGIARHRNYLSYSL